MSFGKIKKFYEVFGTDMSNSAGEYSTLEFSAEEVSAERGRKAQIQLTFKNHNLVAKF